ncbi:MAG TPA: hypothetical protein VFG86_12570 [Chloroflexota bacterium]|nr:hypothetical protein [Chloroflexota bacterium]
MHKRRQRHLRVAPLTLLIGLLAAACSPAAQSDARTAATAVAGLASSAQPVATEVARRVGDLDPSNVGRLIGTVIGANVEITLEPQEVPNDQVTRATVNGIDRSGAFERLDVPARRSFASAGLQLARQSYPRAQIDMTIVDQSGNRLLAVTYPPDGQPAFQ